MLGTFITVAFLLGPRVCASVHEPFKSGFFIPYNPMVLLEVSPLVFEARHFEVGSLPLQYSSVGFGCLMWEHKSFGPWEQDLYYDEAWVGFLMRWCLSYSTQCGPSIFCCGGAILLAFGSFSEEIVQCVVVDLLCSWEEASSGPYKLPILNLVQQNVILFQVMHPLSQS